LRPRAARAPAALAMLAMLAWVVHRNGDRKEQDLVDGSSAPSPRDGGGLPRRPATQQAAETS
jgi:hypothetical protein